jgi:hypothetical protein
LIVAVSNVLPDIVPGAMCGTGVIQATEGMGNRALVFRFLAVFMLFLRCDIEKIDRTNPDSLLVQTNARFLLMAIPVLFLSMTATFQAISGLNVQQPVDCCAAVYDAVRSSGDISVAAKHTRFRMGDFIFNRGCVFDWFWVLECGRFISSKYLMKQLFDGSDRLCLGGYGLDNFAGGTLGLSLPGAEPSLSLVLVFI